DPVLAGIDVLAGENFARLQGKRVGLLTNQTGRASTGESTIDLLAHAPGVTLVSLFSPEHGIRGVLDDKVPSSRDEKTGLPIHSLYGDTRRPTAAMLDGLDTLVVDLQDIGARFYTYPATVGYVLEEAARRKLPVVVLDRPNPVDGFDVEGPVQDAAAIGFTGYLPMPIRHGLTLGELARLFNAEQKMGAKLGGQLCHGVFLIVTDRDRLRPVRLGLEIASALSRLYGAQFKLEDAATLFGSKATLEKIRAGDDPAAIAASWAADEAKWRLTRAKYLLY